MSSTAFIEPLPVIDFVTRLLNREVSSRPLSDADRVKVSVFDPEVLLVLVILYSVWPTWQSYFLGKPP